MNLQGTLLTRCLVEQVVLHGLKQTCWLNSTGEAVGHVTSQSGLVMLLCQSSVRFRKKGNRAVLWCPEPTVCPRKLNMNSQSSDWKGVLHLHLVAYRQKCSPLLASLYCTLLYILWSVLMMSALRIFTMCGFNVLHADYWSDCACK